MSHSKCFVILLIHYQGGAASCTGSTPEEAIATADRLQSKFPKKTYIFRTDIYEAVPSVKFPGVWDVSIPEDMLAMISEDVVKLYHSQVD